MFVRGSSTTTYYQVADVYLSARRWLLNNAPYYPILRFKVFEDSSGVFDTLLEHQVCYQAVLDQTANNTMGAAIDPYCFKQPVDGYYQYDPNEDTTTSSTWQTVSTLSFEPTDDERIHLYQVKFKVKTSLSTGAEASYEIRCQKAGEAEEVLATGTVSYTSYTTISHSYSVWGKPGQQVTVKFRVCISSYGTAGGIIWSKDYYMFYGLQQKWSGWNEWYDNIIRNSFLSPGGWATLRIDNYEPSLYMGTCKATYKA